jgi:SAM-dependent methyltransferase
MVNHVCPACRTPLENGLTNWHFVCPMCHYELGDLTVSINLSDGSPIMDESLREVGIRKLRVKNFTKIVKVLRPLAPRPNSFLLDVGAAHGWFLETARPFFKVMGVEPDESVFHKTAAKGLPIRCGYFPDALAADECFDVIVFNDVIEHIPDIGKTLDVCRERLNPDGILFLNLPNSRGIFYKTARLMCRMGLAKPFERLWQKGFPSPHLHYMNPTNLELLLKQHGLTQVSSGFLPSVSLHGLYERLSYDSDMKTPTKVVMYLLLVISLPLIAAMPKDIMYGVFQKR